MKIYFAPAPTANYTKKKVWSRSFIWMEVLVNLESNKQYPTLVQYGVKIHIPIQVMSAIAFLDSLKFSRFIEYTSEMKTTTKQTKINVLFYSYL